MYIYIDGSFVLAEHAKISVFDHGYMYGLGLFETFRIYDGHPFLMDDHFRRLEDGLQHLAIHWSMTKSETLAILGGLLEKNELQDAYVRWNVSAGYGDVGLYTGIYDKPTTIVYMKPLPKRMETSKKAKILRIPRNTPEGSERLKSHHYLNNVLAKREIGDRLDIEGLFLTEKGDLAEGIVSNLFWVKNGVVYTPSLETGILNGVTRQFVLALLKREGIRYQEGLYKKEVLFEADEAFVTNSIQEIISLTACDDVLFSEDRPVITYLQGAYKQARKMLMSKDELRKE
ncbi:aminodeoxychorismate lyase [Bacillus solitudinis]|uniref:aminodeoxychorismate lyase n=1 Tax=Bacillus solitudinis TaxID=2014074 RepID=UPI000C246365|nr:aminodeoxychorismate lyase [Bacillus solitudinis]